MQIHNVKQGSADWLALRPEFFTASNAPTIMACGYDSRTDAIEYALGIKEKKITDGLQSLFDKAHEMEEGARNQHNDHQSDLANIIQPLVGSNMMPMDSAGKVHDLKLLASFDGITEDHSLVWEHKYTNKEFDEIPPIYYWQLEHQMLVAECNNSQLTITSRNDGSITHFDYQSVPDRRDALIKGWHQWKIDVEKYVRDDIEWMAYAKVYTTAKAEIDRLTIQLKESALALHELAGSSSALGGGVKVNVKINNEKKQSAAQYIKENHIELLNKSVEPFYTYRITTKGK
nr:hypothetical protein [Rhodospirillales bacterium]